MAIVLTLKPKQDVFVGTEQVVLKDIFSPTSAVLQHEGKDYPVGTDDWVDLMDGCQVRLGKPRDHWTDSTRREVRVQFEAPMYHVLRGSTYRNREKEMK